MFFAVLQKVLLLMRCKNLLNNFPVLIILNFRFIAAENIYFQTKKGAYFYEEISALLNCALPNF